MRLFGAIVARLRRNGQSLGLVGDLDELGLLADLDSRFGTSLKPEDLTRIETAGDLFDHLASHIERAPKWSEFAELVAHHGARPDPASITRDTRLIG